MNAIFSKFSMLKSVIKSGAEGDSKDMMQLYKTHLSERGLDFVEKKRPPPQAYKPVNSPANGAGKVQVEDKEDYTTEAELNALFNQQPAMAKEATVYVNLLIGMSVDEFYKTYLQEDAEKCMLKWYTARGEKINS
jgi:hypothetical protein